MTPVTQKSDPNSPQITSPALGRSRAIAPPATPGHKRLQKFLGWSLYHPATAALAGLTAVLTIYLIVALLVMRSA